MLTGTINNLNRLTSVSEGGVLQASYTYDTNGNRASLTYSNGVVESYQYNLASWITGLTNSKGGTTLSSFDYTYYTSGNQKTETDQSGRTIGYAYDDLGQLTIESVGNDLTCAYLYYETGNRRTKTFIGSRSDITTYTYDANNRLTSKSATGGSTPGTTTYTYDDNGNLLTELNVSNGAIITHTYNNFNQLISTVVGTTVISYTYNAQGIRTSRTIGDNTTEYLLDGGNVVGEVNGTTVTDYLYGANLISNGSSYYLYNAHGDVVQLTNSAGAVTKTYDYDAFGIEESPDTTDTNPFRYCGEYYDTATGLYYLRARYYDPLVGRFTQEDTHWNTANMIYGDNPRKINARNDALGLTTYSYAPQIQSIMQSGNLYVYCMYNPIGFTDWTGKFAKELKQTALIEGGIYGGGPVVLTLWLFLENYDILSQKIVHWVETNVGEKFYRDPSVYVLKDAFGHVQYVGRTNNPVRRLHEHQHDLNHPERAKYDMVVLLSGLTKSESKLFEQLVISAYSLAYLDNARREISIGNVPAYEKYVSSVQSILEGNGVYVDVKAIMDLLVR